MVRRETKVCQLPMPVTLWEFTAKPGERARPGFENIAIPWQPLAQRDRVGPNRASVGAHALAPIFSSTNPHASITQSGTAACMR